MNFKKILVCVLSMVLAANVATAASAKKADNSFDKKVSEINLCLEKNDYRTADRLIFESIHSNPGDVQIQILSAISLTMQDKLDPAQDILDSVKKSALKYADLYYAQGAIYLKRVDTSDMRFRNKNEELIQLAVNQLNYSLKINPNNARVYNALGVAELKRGDLFKAQQNFEKAISLSPKYATALDNLGSIYYITNEIDKAEPYFKKAEAVNPTSSTVYYHLAQVAFKNNELQKALYYANKSLLWNKRSTYAQNLIGEIYKKQGNEAAAISSFKKSIFLMPENTEPYINLAGIYESRGDINAAIEELKTCLSVTPDNDSVKLSLADLILATGQYEDAIKYYSQLSDSYKTESIEGLVSAYYSLATESANKAMFKSNRRLADSLTYINQAIKESPDNLELYLTKSKLNRLINNQVESKEVLLKIVSAPNTNISDLITKGDAFIALNQYRDARNIYSQVVKIDKPVESDLYLAEFFTYNKQFRHAKDSLDNVFAENPDNEDALANLAYINKMLDTSNKHYKNARYFKKRHDRFFQKVYLNKALKFNPNNADANIMLAGLLKKEKDIYGANACYKKALGELDNEKQIKKVACQSRKLDKKIAKLENTADKEVKVKEEKIQPVKTEEKIQKEDIKPAVNKKVKEEKVKPVKTKKK